MNILLTTHRFYPDVGGTETQAELMAEEFAKAGHKTVVVTQTIGPAVPSLGYELVRRPNIGRLLQLYRWSDVVLQRTVALRTAWPLLFIRRPWVVIQNDWIDRDNSLRTRLKRHVIGFAKNVAISQAVADRLPVPATIILNAYRNELFKPPPGNGRRHDLIFVGRLIRGKGVQTLIEAVRELRRRGFYRELTIVGTGSEHSELIRAAEGLPITFLGVKRGRELSEVIADHKTLVVPSLEPEPFGIVALEGLASGCAVVASRGGGLPEAVGPHGVLFEPGNPTALADAIVVADAAPELLKGVAEHLARHEADYVAGKYLKLLGSAIADHRRLDIKRRRSMNVLKVSYKLDRKRGMLKRFPVLDKYKSLDINRFCDHSVYVNSLNHHSVVIDLGANRGRFAKAIFRRFGCTPFCVEPNPLLCAVLRSECNFGVYNAAVAAQSGKGVLQVTTNDECSSLMMPTISPIEHQIECELITLPELLKRLQLSRVNLLKLDIEGAEIEVLLNAPVEILELVEQITVEFHESIGLAKVEDATRVIGHLRDAGFGVIRGSYFDYSDVLFVNLNKLVLNKFWRLQANAGAMRNGLARGFRRLQQGKTNTK
jgi:glycogen synthase